MQSIHIYELISLKDILLKKRIKIKKQTLFFISNQDIKKDSRLYSTWYISKKQVFPEVWLFILTDRTTMKRFIYTIFALYEHLKSIYYVKQKNFFEKHLPPNLGRFS